jgi:hypothetical protein
MLPSLDCSSRRASYSENCIWGVGPELADLALAAASTEHRRFNLIGKQFGRGIQSRAVTHTRAKARRPARPNPRASSSQRRGSDGYRSVVSCRGADGARGDGGGGGQPTLDQSGRSWHRDSMWIDPPGLFLPGAIATPDPVRLHELRRVPGAAGSRRLARAGRTA